MPTRARWREGVGAQRLRYMCLVNAPLPDTDYRLCFARNAQEYEVLFALPQRPTTVPPERFARLAMGAGLSKRDLRELLRVRRILRSRKVNVAHFFSTQLTTLGPLLARSTGVTPIITVTGLGRVFDDNQLRSKGMRALYRLLFLVNLLLSRAVLFQNASDMDVLCRSLPGPLRARCRLVGSAIDFETFAALGHQRTEDSKSKCLLVARLIPQKGIDDYLDLAARLSSTAEFTLVGAESAEYPALAQRVREAAYRGVIRYPGELRGDELRAEYAAHDVFVFTSYSEGLPRVLLEATLSGMACVAYDIPGNRTVLGENALYAPRGDVDGLIVAVEELMWAPERRERLAGEAQQRVRALFDPSHYVEHMRQVLNGAYHNSRSREAHC